MFLSFAPAHAFAAQPQTPLANVTIAYTSKRVDARKASPGQFINTKIVEKLNKQGFIDDLFRK